MFNIYPKSSREMVSALLRPFQLYIVIAYPIYLYLRSLYDGAGFAYIAEGFAAIFLLSCVVLLISAVAGGFCRDSFLGRWAIVNFTLAAAGVILGWQLMGDIFVKI